MTILEQVYASGGDVIIHTLEITCAAWDEPILLCEGFENQSVIDENGRSLTFEAAAFQLAEPERSNRGSQTLDFAVDGVMGEAQQKVDAALEAEERITLIYRKFLASNLTEPAERPYRMTILGGEMNGSTVQLQAGFFDLINRQWPRDAYSTTFSPGLRYA